MKEKHALGTKPRQNGENESAPRESSSRLVLADNPDEAAANDLASRGLRSKLSAA